MAFLSLNLYDTPVLAPRMNVLFWGPGDFPVSYSSRNTSWNAWNRHSEKFIVDMGILFSNISLSLMNVKWHSDLWPTVTSHLIRLSTNFTTLIPSLTFTEISVVSMEHLQRMRACQQGMLILPDTWFRSPFWDLLVLQLLRPDSSISRLFTLNTPWFCLVKYAYCWKLK